MAADTVGFQLFPNRLCAMEKKNSEKKKQIKSKQPCGKIQDQPVEAETILPISKTACWQFILFKWVKFLGYSVK